MKKLMMFISILILIFIILYIMIFIDNKYIGNIKRDIINNTSVKNIEYVNKYDGYYIVLDKEYIYLFNTDYLEIYKSERDKLCDNQNNYDLVYRDSTIMYMESYKDKDGLIFKYYDIYSYELIDEIIIGGNYE